jgi:hypothetical protein
MESIIDRHAGLVGQTCRFAPIKKAPLSANVAKPNRLTAFFIFYP